MPDLLSLRKENSELKLQLMQGGGGALSGIEAQELKDLREKVPKLLRDNKDLTASEYIMRKLILAPLMF